VVESVNSYFARTRRGAATRNRGRVKSFTNAVLLDIFFAVLSVSGMALAAVVSERENLLRNQAAIETRLRLAAIVESSDDAMMSVDTDGIITDWNKGAERLYGYTETEAIGLPLANLVPPNLLDEENNILQRSKAGERIEHYETIRVTESGKNVDVSLTKRLSWANSGFFQDRP
jgi:PAS domain S-box-containing protein